MEKMPQLFHIGRKIRRLREIKGMKQEALAIELGISHQAVSKMEQSEEIDEDKLEQVAKVLGVAPDVIKNFDEEAAINLFNHICNNQFDNQSIAMVYQQTNNPLDKIIDLYERMLETERSKVKLLEDLLKTKG